MKKEITEFFRFDRTYQGGITLYMRYGHSMSLRKQLNLQQESIELRQMLFEELRALADIDHLEMQSIMSAAVFKNPFREELEEEQDPLEFPVPGDQLPAPETKPQTPPGFIRPKR